MEEQEQRALDEQCAHALGYDTIWADSIFGHTLYLWDKGAVRTPYGASNCHVLGASWEKLRVNGDVCELMVRICPAFAGRLEDAKILEDEIERRGLAKDYALALIDVCRIPNRALIDLSGVFTLVHASPEQRARAFLEVMECKSK
jgi:hypothetical protein